MGGRRRTAGAAGTGRVRLLACALLLGCGGGGEAGRDDGAAAAGRDPGARTVADSAFADSVLRAAEDLEAVVEVRNAGLPAPVRDTVAIRVSLQAHARETYLGELLAARDSVLYRWPERRDPPLHLWVQDASLARTESDFPRIVREAVLTWMETDVPVAFQFTTDSATADVRVTWVDRYESRTTGRTRWVHDPHGWILGASIELARAQPDGRPLDLASLRAIALHEVGHLLGLDHVADSTSIMAARIRVTELSEADRNTVRLVYRLPPGRLGAP